jgi:hypothetical protein
VVVGSREKPRGREKRDEGWEKRRGTHDMEMEGSNNDLGGEERERKDTLELSTLHCLRREEAT